MAATIPGGEFWDEGDRATVVGLGRAGFPLAVRLDRKRGRVFDCEEGHLRHIEVEVEVEVEVGVAPPSSSRAVRGVMGGVVRGGGGGDAASDGGSSEGSSGGGDSGDSSSSSSSSKSKSSGRHITVSVPDSDPRALIHVSGVAPNRWGLLRDGTDVRQVRTPA
jgi:hypothetical protein